MSWEAFRLTSKSPSELYHILEPHGIDEKVGDMLRTCWREYAGPDRTLDSVRRFAQQVFDRNLRHWRAIKKPSPAAFFENLLPYAADGHIRQALVLCWMMMARGKRSIPVVADAVTHIYERHLSNWAEDQATLTGTTKPKKSPGVKKSARKSAKKPAKRQIKRPVRRPPKPRR